MPAVLSAVSYTHLDVYKRQYVDYFDFVTYFHELLEDGHIKKISVPCDGAKEYQSEQSDENSVTELDNSSDNDAQTKDLYEVSETGRMIAKGLADDLLIAAVREKSYISAMRHLSLEKRGAVVDHRIEMVGDGTYIFHCSIKDCDGMAFDLAPVSYTHLDVYKRQGQTRVKAAYNNVGVSSVRLSVFVAYKVNSVG